MTRPLILVVGRWSDQIGRKNSQGVFTPRRLLDAISRAGGEPVMVWPDTADRAERLVGLADGVVLPGGNDLDLRPFGVPEVHPREHHSPPEQDAADVTVGRAALAARLPVLAICRGMQVLNVIMGGTIHQHFDETTVPHAPAARTPSTCCPVPDCATCWGPPGPPGTAVTTRPVTGSPTVWCCPPSPPTR
jgi:putative glutamine amidotransferase